MLFCMYVYLWILCQIHFLWIWLWFSITGVISNIWNVLHLFFTFLLFCISTHLDFILTQCYLYLVNV